MCESRGFKFYSFIIAFRLFIHRSSCTLIKFEVSRQINNSFVYKYQSITIERITFVSIFDNSIFTVVCYTNFIEMTLLYDRRLQDKTLVMNPQQVINYKIIMSYECHRYRHSSGRRQWKTYPSAISE